MPKNYMDMQDVNQLIDKLINALNVEFNECCENFDKDDIILSKIKSLCIKRKAYNEVKNLVINHMGEVNNGG